MTLCVQSVERQEEQKKNKNRAERKHGNKRARLNGVPRLLSQLAIDCQLTNKEHGRPAYDQSVQMAIQQERERKPAESLLWNNTLQLHCPLCIYLLIK